jgi:phenylpropionate dioxygenase-like ring-hydroxylating dioxygenase large terminal subunit
MELDYKTLLRTPKPLTQQLRKIPYALDVWVPVLRARKLRHKSIHKTKILGRDFILFRDAAGQVACIEDRCPHRGVALSLGRWQDGAVQCAYHGWLIDRTGARVGADISEDSDSPCVNHYAAAEHVRVVWVFLGDISRASLHPLPDLSPFGSDTVDLLIVKRIHAHWSLILDNGIDLFHQHLHRTVPIFFRIQKLIGYGREKDGFHIFYQANLSAIFGQRKIDVLHIHVNGPEVMLDMAGHPVVRAFGQPLSSDGRDVILWWFISIKGTQLSRFITRVIKGFVWLEISRGFNQDVVVLESEQRALDQGASQKEVNPVIFAAHEYMFDYSRNKFREWRDHDLPIEKVAAMTLVDEVERGKLMAARWHNREMHLLDAATLARLISDRAWVKICRYHHAVVILE